MKCERLLVCFCVYLLICGTVIDARDIVLIDALDSNGIRLQWDPYKQIGRMFEHGHGIAFKPGVPYVMVDFILCYPIIPIMHEQGALLISETALKTVLELFESFEQVEIPVHPVNPDYPSYPYILYIDPGHGGDSPGAVRTFVRSGTKTTIYEKGINLAIALQLRQILASTLQSVRVEMSRTEDITKHIEVRVNEANSLSRENDEEVLFVSIHANTTISNPEIAKGYEIFVLTPAHERTIIDETEFEEYDTDVLSILNSMEQDGVFIESTDLALLIGEEMERLISPDISPNRGVKYDRFTVNREVKVPSVLIEVGFISHEQEAFLLVDENHQEKIAKAIFNGISRFIASYAQWK